MSEHDKLFVLLFIKYLKKLISNGKLSTDSVESVEVGIQCLEAGFGFDVEEVVGAAGTSAGIDEKHSNLDLYEIFLSKLSENTDVHLKLAEDVKNEGNNLMKNGKYAEALEKYNKAISLDSKNPVFYCNRAAAFTKLHEYQKAITDCKMSILYNPDYGKAYGRMGVAFTSLKKYDEAIMCYKKAIEKEPGNPDYRTNLNVVIKLKDEAIVANNTANETNFAHQFFQNFPCSNPEVRDMLLSLVTDPSVAEAYAGVSDGTEILNRTRQLLFQMTQEYPEYMRDIQTGVFPESGEFSGTRNVGQSNVPGQQQTGGGQSQPSERPSTQPHQNVGNKSGGNNNRENQ